jgi:hypothetical protein
MNNFLSAKIVPIFYISIGAIFLFFPEIPHYDIINKEKHTIVALTFTREIGILFIIIGLLIRKVYFISKSVYRLMNTTFIIIMLLLSSIGPMMYFLLPSQPIQLVYTTLINVAFAFIYILERKQ